MAVAILGAKALLAVMLLVAGGSKLAGLDAFAATVLLLAPRPVRAVLAFRAPGPRAGARRAAWAVALGELVLGSASLAVPAAGWLNLAVLAAACAFAAVSAAGFAFHRGRSCRCFGALSQRRFDLAGLARSAAVLALAGLATAGSATAGRATAGRATAGRGAAVPLSDLALSPADRALLLAGSALIVFLLWFQVRLDVMINNGFGTFFNVLQ